MQRLNYLKNKLGSFQEKNEKLILEGAEQEFFTQEHLRFQKKFPGMSLDKLMEKFEYLEETGLNLVRKVSQLEDDLLVMENAKKKVIAEYQEKISKLERKDIEREKHIIFLENLIDDRKEDLKSINSYQASYLSLAKMITSLFIDW